MTFDALDDGESDDGGETAWVDGEAEVTCPYCGESMTITVDPTGGAEQVYVEDCQVCCQPWQVRVHVGENETIDVSVEPLA
jgi:transcription elongation factor Elf1